MTESYPKRRAGIYAMAVATMAFLSACTGGTGMQPTMTLAEANAAVDEHIANAVAQIPGDPELDERGRSEDFPCGDPDDHGPQGRKIADRDYEVLGIDPEQIPSYFDTLKAWWLANGFAELDNEPRYEYLWVENTSDGVRMSLQANDHGNLYITAASPCVWPNGTPSPE